MKKNFLVTTVLLAASQIAGMASAAEPLKVGVSGDMRQWFGVVNQTTSGNATTPATARDYANTGMNSDTEVDFTATTTLDNGLEVMTRIVLDIIDNGNGAANAGFNNAPGLHEEWASIGSAKYGKFFAGVKESSNASMHNEAVDVGIGYGDVDQWIRAPSGTASFAATNDWDYTSLEGHINDTLSVSYISPQFYGFQFGTTFASNGHGGTGAAATIGSANRATHQTDAWDTTLAYSSSFGGVTLGADVGVGGGQGSQTAQNGITATSNVWNTGLKASYAGFTVGAAFFSYNDDLSNSTSANNFSLDGNSWNAGVAYEYGPWSTSFLYYHEQHKGLVNSTVTTFTSRQGHDEFNTYLLSGKYALGPGIDVKASGFFGQYVGRNFGATNINYYTEGLGLVTGLDLTF